MHAIGMVVRQCRGGVGNWKLVTTGAGILVKEETGAHQTHHLTHPLIIMLLLIMPFVALVAEKEKEKLLPHDLRDINAIWVSKLATQSKGCKCTQDPRGSFMTVMVKIHRTDTTS